MGMLFPHKVAYAKKYESLTVRKQFQPVMYYDDFVLEVHPDWQKDNIKCGKQFKTIAKFLEPLLL